MIGQSATCRSRCDWSRGVGDGSRFCRVGFFLTAIRFQFLQPQLQLLDLPCQLLRLPSKLHAVQLDQQQLQMLNLPFAREQLLVLCQDQRAQRLGRKRFRSGSAVTAMRRVSHELTRFHLRSREKSCGKYLLGYTDNCGSQVRSGRRQSMPSSSIDNCARVRETVPLVACGHTKRPRSSRFANKHKPSPSNQSTLIRSPRRPRNTNTCPENGLCSSFVCTCALSPVKPRRKSVTPAAIQIRVFAGHAIMLAGTPATRALTRDRRYLQSAPAPAEA